MQTNSADFKPSEDPEEVDITNHVFKARASPSPLFTNNGLSQDDIRHLLQGGSPLPDTKTGRFGTPGQQVQGDGSGGDQDPVMKMLQQIMGETYEGTGGGENGDGGLPPGLAAMLGGGTGQSGSIPQENTYNYVWKIVHAIFALSLGIYITATSSFNGSQLSRTTIAEGDNVGVQFFWFFATTELVLQSSRLFLERGKASQGGIIGTVAGFFPEPWKGYMGLVSRYSGIYSTIVEDATAVVFVLGVVAWWQGLAG